MIMQIAIFNFNSDYLNLFHSVWVFRIHYSIVSLNFSFDLSGILKHHHWTKHSH